MKIKPKGRKIYKTKEKNYYGKSPLGKFLSGALTVLLIGGIGFIGYSAAEPIINYSKRIDDDPIVPTDFTESFTETTTEPTSGIASQPAHPAVTKAPEPPAAVRDDFTAAVLPENAMISIEAITGAIAAVPSGSVEYIEVPLKLRGGKLMYASQIPAASNSGAVQSQLTVQEIAQVIGNSGYKPAASISVFEDSILPATYPETGYITLDTGSQWIDNDVSSGGKPWITPYSDNAVEYLSAIADEITRAGFDRIVCSDLKYPEFRESDLMLLDERLGRSDRCMGLTAAANLMYTKALSNGASMMIEVSAADIMRGSADILQPMLLSANSVVVNIDTDMLAQGIEINGEVVGSGSTPEEITEKCLGIVREELLDFNVTVRISGASKPADELLKAKDKAAGMGFSSFVIG